MTIPEGWVQETDKAWDAIHRCLTDGTLVEGDTPGHLCVLGATDYFWVVLDDGQVDWIVNLLDPGEVRETAAAIRVGSAFSQRRDDAVKSGRCPARNEDSRYFHGSEPYNAIDSVRC
jgi:Domain of unknown function (DUF1877)